MRALNHEEFMIKVKNDYYKNRMKSKEADSYEGLKGVEINRKHALHRKRKGY